MTELSDRERIVIPIDTSEKSDAVRLAKMAKEIGARFIRMGVELSSAFSWDYCSDLAGRHDLDWIADANLYDKTNNVVAAAKNIASKEYPPFAMTIDVRAGMDAMTDSQLGVGDVMMLGSTELDSTDTIEGGTVYGLPRRVLVKRLAIRAKEAKLKGVVVASNYLNAVREQYGTKEIFTMVTDADAPFSRFKGKADLLVIDNPIIKAPVPYEAYASIVKEIS